MKITRRKAKVLGCVLTPVVRMLGCTWRVRRHGFAYDLGPGYLTSFLHGNILTAAYLHRDQNGATLISQHNDGELIAGVARRLGYQPVRGSASRGGARAFLEILKDYQDVAMGFTPDGPRGPRGRVHEGIIQLAAESGRAICAHGYAASPAKVMDSWDKFLVPYPFARIVEYACEPLVVEKGVSKEQRKELAKRLEGMHVEAEAEAERYLADWLKGS